MLNYLKKLWKKIGPGFITGAADDDPSGVATYSQTGVIFGYSQLWLALFTFPFMIVIQQMCGRIGMVTGQGLAGVIRAHYPKPVLYCAVTLLVIANTINIGADLGAMAASAQMLLGLPFLFWILLMTGFIIALEVFVTYKTYSKILRYLALTLFAYVFTAFIVKLDCGNRSKKHGAPTNSVFKRLYAQYRGNFRNHDFPIFVFLAGITRG